MQQLIVLPFHQFVGCVPYMAVNVFEVARHS